MYPAVSIAGPQTQIRSTQSLISDFICESIVSLRVWFYGAVRSCPDTAAPLHSGESNGSECL
jgi:hypothetical protein